MKSEIAIAAMIPSVCAAFFDCGRLNALTPFEIDSTPVSAADPEANARRTTRIVTAPVPAAIGCGTVAVGQEYCISAVDAGQWSHVSGPGGVVKTKETSDGCASWTSGVS